MTLRIDAKTRGKLYDYALRYSKKVGRHVSLNECIVNLIQETC